MSTKYTENFEEVKKLINEGINRSMRQLGATLEEDIKKAAPVDTGELRDSVTHRAKDNELLLGAKAEHAPSVELGTSRMRGRPFLKGTVMSNLNKIERVVNSNMPK